MTLFAVVAVALAVPKVLRTTSRWIRGYNRKCERLEIEASCTGPTILWAENGLLWKPEELEVVRKCDCIYHLSAAKQRADRIRKNHGY